MTDNKEKWFTLAEAAHYTGVASGTLSSAIRKGTLVASQISDGGGRYGYHYMVSESALFDWVEDRKKIRAEAVTVPTEATVDSIAEWITSQIQKAYEAGFKEGMKKAKTQMLEAAKGLK